MLGGIMIIVALGLALLGVLAVMLLIVGILVMAAAYTLVGFWWACARGIDRLSWTYRRYKGSHRPKVAA